jgi:hypothetical protein
MTKKITHPIVLPFSKYIRFNYQKNDYKRYPSNQNICNVEDEI